MQVLRVFPHPLSCTALQFAMGAVLACLCWAVGIVKRPKITWDVIKSIWPLAVVHTLGNLLTNVSLGAVAVSSHAPCSIFTNSFNAQYSHTEILAENRLKWHHGINMSIATFPDIARKVACF